VNIVTKEKPNAEKLGVKLTFLPFIIKAVVEALKENPHFNASYDHETQEIIVKKYYNIGLAAEAKDGLKVLVIKDADKKNIIDIAKEIQELHKKILDETITIDEMRDSTFTITNIGSMGGGFLSVPMINYPEIAILGVHMIKDMPVVENGKVKAGKVLPISLSFDHRVVDGADAVKFGNAVIKYLEDVEFLEMLG
jgi:pyruvate dehydrogenase E2 component (dihydrolipoamide acetyltransferase)